MLSHICAEHRSNSKRTTSSDHRHYWKISTDFVCIWNFTATAPKNETKTKLSVGEERCGQRARSRCRYKIFWFWPSIAYCISDYGYNSSKYKQSCTMYDVCVCMQAKCEPRRHRKVNNLRFSRKWEKVINVKWVRRLPIRDATTGRPTRLNQTTNRFIFSQLEIYLRNTKIRKTISISLCFIIIFDAVAVVVNANAIKWIDSAVSDEYLVHFDFVLEFVFYFLRINDVILHSPSTYITSR